MAEEPGPAQARALRDKAESQAAASDLGGRFTGQLGQTISKVLPGALGSTLSGLVGPLGALAGPLIGKIFSSFGPSEAELAGREATKRFAQGIGLRALVVAPDAAGGDGAIQCVQPGGFQQRQLLAGSGADQDVQQFAIHVDAVRACR